jgi:hypothetical protein
MRISWRLSLVWAMLAAAIAVPWADGVAPPPPAGPAPQGSETPAPAPTALPGPDEMTETTARPLFTASRRPAPAPAAPGPAASSAPRKPTRLVGYRLTGIVRSSSQRMILLTEEKSGRVLELHEGDEVDGWRLMSIEGDHARLSRDGLEIDFPEQNTGASGVGGRNTRWLPSGGERR